MNTAVLFQIPQQQLQDIFGWSLPQLKTQLLSLLKKVVVTQKDTQTLEFDNMFSNIGDFLFSHLSHQYPVRMIDNPFSNWTRTPKRNKQFHLGHRKREIPDFQLKFSPKLVDDTLYIVNGYASNAGDNSDVISFVVWNGKICVLKIMEQGTQPVIELEDLSSFFATASNRAITRQLISTVTGVTDNIIQRIIQHKVVPKKILAQIMVQLYAIMPVRHTSDMFELVIQAFLHAHCNYSHILIPTLHFVQPYNGRIKKFQGKTMVCMEKVSGIFLSRLKKQMLLIALAHVMKALFVLQRDFRFLHRDFHHDNVAYDNCSHRVSIIDFGMSCVTPVGGTGIAWQSHSEFYHPMDQSKTTACINCSLDVCTLVASLHQSHPTLTEEMVQLEREMRRLILSNSASKTKMENAEFTDVKKHNWKMGNKIGKGQRGWWLYDTAEFEMIQWDPRSMLSRLLCHIPIVEWSHLQRDFPEFKSYVPKNLIVTGHGVLTHVSETHIYVRSKETVLKYLYADMTDIVTTSASTFTIGQEIEYKGRTGYVSNTYMSTNNNTLGVIIKDKIWTEITVNIDSGLMRTEKTYPKTSRTFQLE